MPDEPSFEERKRQFITSYLHVGQLMASLETQAFIIDVQLRGLRSQLPLIITEPVAGRRTMCPRCQGNGRYSLQHSADWQESQDCDRCYGMNWSDWEREFGLYALRIALRGSP